MITIHHFNDSAPSEQIYQQGNCGQKKRNGNIVYKTVQPYRAAAETLPEATGFLPPWVSNHSNTIYDNAWFTIPTGHREPRRMQCLWEYIVYVSNCALVSVFLAGLEGPGFCSHIGNKSNLVKISNQVYSPSFSTLSCFLWWTPKCFSHCHKQFYTQCFWLIKNKKLLCYSAGPVSLNLSEYKLLNKKVPFLLRH